MKIGKYIFTFLMAFVLTTSAIPVWAGQHYCQGKLVSTSFFSEASSCGMEHGEDTNHSHHTQFNKKDCCQDLIQLKEGVNHNTTITAHTFSEVVNLVAVHFKPTLLKSSIFNREILIPTLLSLPPPLHQRFSFIQVWLL